METSAATLAPGRTSSPSSATRWSHLKSRILGTESGHVSLSVWAFRFLLWYICVMLVQPQNRYTFLWPLHIADISFVGACVLHFLDCLQNRRPFLSSNASTWLGLGLIILAYISNTFGVFQNGWAGWNPYMDVMVKNLLLFILVGTMARSVERVWALQMVVLSCTLWWVKSGLRLSASGATFSGDRLMGAAIGLIENPNSFAYMLCFMLPLYLYAYQQSTRKWAKWFFLAGALASVYTIFQTGSRTGMVTLIAIGIFLLPHYGRGHWRSILIIVVAVAIMLPFSGERNIQRFKTIPQSALRFLGFKSEDSELNYGRPMNQDEQSSDERSSKNLDTWRLIMNHPLFGVGMVPSGDKLAEEGYPMARGQVHCEILMVGKQMGFIGMFLYAGSLLTAWFCGEAVKRKARRMQWSSIGALGWTFQMQVVANAVGGFFCPGPWGSPMMIMVGSSIALWTALRDMPVEGVIRAV